MRARDDRRWLDNAEHWGEWERFDTETGERESLWMLKSKSSPKVRFYAIGKGRVGSEHAHVAAATCWAFANAYLGVSEDPMDIFLQLACRAEVLAGGAPADRHAGERVDAATPGVPPAPGVAGASRATTRTPRRKEPA